ncbi:MAG: DoxX family protein [Rhodothermales bacterium]
MTKRNKIIYWVATLWLALGMVSTGVVQLLQLEEGQGGAASIAHLGFPLYMLTLLGIWKLLGVVAVLLPRYPLVKEWAYAGFFFAMTGAIYSHAAVGDAVVEMLPALLLLVLTGLSWYFRPAGRKMAVANPGGAS